ncbi:hypothetical protein INR49_015306, partial [Caranx melampygus]
MTTIKHLYFILTYLCFPFVCQMRTLREKTTLAVTSKGRFGAEEERGSGGTSTRRRLAPRSLATITVGGHESIMVQTLRLEEQQRAKEEKRQRELEKKEAEEMSAKEVEEWEQTLLSQASPHPVDTLWELPAIGHFLCLAQTALNLPEIVFFELERCLLMPRCSLLLSKIMSSLLSPPQRRATLHRRPPLPYRRWESELRQRVMGWYRVVGASHDQLGRAEQLGLCHQFFSILGEVSPLEEKPFHLLHFYQRVWLLKGLCDHVYETQKGVQDAVLAQPIHECRESVLGYDSKENAYIHFPHFCGADLRIYCQSPSTPPALPFPSVLVKRVEIEQGTEGDESDGMKAGGNKGDRECFSASMDTGESDEFGKERAETLRVFKRENGDREEDKKRFKLWSMKKQEGSESGSSDGDSCEDSKLDLKIHTNTLSLSQTSPTGRSGVKMTFKEETAGFERQSKRLALKQEPDFSLSSMRTIKAETQEPCLSVGEHSYTGRSPARSVNLASPTKCWSSKWREAVPVRITKDLPVWNVVKAKLVMLNQMGTTAAVAYRGKQHSCPLRALKTQLVCTSLEELRELISKTEDELDDLESTKKRLGRWYYRREAVKDLHSTLIRLLNELSPWEPKLVKAYQRNRLRLKKEFDDFKKHPEYNNFVREECISSSSSDEDEERASTRDFVADSAGETTSTYAPPIHLKHPVASTEKGVNLLPRLQTGSTNITSTVHSGLQSRSELIPSNQSRDSNSAWTAGSPAQTSPSPRPTILHPTTGLPKGYTPIPTLLAKSVGNKVTLMKRPADCPGVNSIERKSKGSLVSLPTSAVATTKPSNAQTSPSCSQQTSQQIQAQGLQQLQVHSQPGMATVTAAPLKSPQAKPSQTVPKSPVQVVYKVPEGLGHLVRKDNSSPVKISVHPVGNQNTGEKVMQQVVILPSNLLLHKTEEKSSSLHQQQSTGIQVPVSKVASPLCMSTNVPGFTIPENRIPVQQVAPLKDARTERTPPPSIPPRQQQGTLSTAGFKGSQVYSSQANTPQTVSPNPSLISTPCSAVSTEPTKSTDPKQELKTVCIRDSQSILVTTRGGNTGIVKVQTSSDHSALGSLPTSPVITISPQFKAFLVSKTSPTCSPSAPSQTSPCTIPAVTAISVAQPPKQVASPKGTPSATKSLPTSRVMFISQPTVTPSTTSMGSIPKQVLATVDSSGQLLTTSLSSQSQKMGLSPHQPMGSGNSEALSKIKNINLPSGVQIQLSGKTTTIGQTIGALSRSPSKNMPVSVSDTGFPATSTSGLVPGIPSFTMFSQIGSSTSTGATLPTGNVIKKDLGMCVSGPSSSFPAQGLGPGSHVLIISSPAPQQVPSASVAGIGASLPSHGASQVTVAPQAPVLPQYPNSGLIAAKVRQCTSPAFPRGNPSSFFCNTPFAQISSTSIILAYFTKPIDCVPAQSCNTSSNTSLSCSPSGSRHAFAFFSSCPAGGLDDNPGPRRTAPADS